MDKQTVEIVGRNYLISQLVADGLEVARPERDRGVDLIAYLDLDEAGGGFRALPIQLKASTRRMFGIDAKYEKFEPSGMLHVFVWNLHDPVRSTTYALTWAEMLDIADTMGWTTTDSWTIGRKYTNNQPGTQLTGFLDPYRVVPGGWKARVIAATSLR